MDQCKFECCNRKGMKYIAAKAYCNVHFLVTKLILIRDRNYDERKLSVRKLRRQLKPTEFEEWKRLTTEILKESKKASIKKTIDKTAVKQYNEDYYQKNKNPIQEYYRIYYQKNKEKIMKQCRDYKQRKQLKQ